MANAFYDRGLEAFLSASVGPSIGGWVGATIRTLLVNQSNYSPNISLHQFLGSISTSARVGTANFITAKTSNSPKPGIADGANVTFTAVNGNQVTHVVIYADVSNNSDTASLLLAIIDTATGLPVTPNGGDITVQWDDGANRIFAI